MVKLSLGRAYPFGIFAWENWIAKINDSAKSRFYPVLVIPAEAGIQLNQETLHSGLRGSDGRSDFCDFIKTDKSP
jgi:hypothetical protein